MWKSALVFFDENLKPLEEHVGQKIKEKLGSCNGSVPQVQNLLLYHLKFYIVFDESLIKKKYTAYKFLSLLSQALDMVEVLLYFSHFLCKNNHVTIPCRYQ